MKLDYNALAQNYARHRQVQPEVLRDLVETSQIGPAAHVLDVGCGTGNYAIALQQASGCTCWGVEPSAKMLDKARERAGELGLAIQFQLAPAEKLDVPEASFDLVVSVDVIHHVGDRPAYFQGAYRALKPGGRLCTVTDSEDIIRRRQPLSVYFPETVAAELARYPSIPTLSGEMAGAGFRQIDEHLAEFPYTIEDIQIFRDKAYSSLHLISEEAFQRGIQRMEQDLQNGPISGVSRYTLLWGTR